MPRGYRIVHSHPCKCGREGCLAWGARKYSDECWDNMPSHVKARMISKAMAGSEIPVAAAIIAPVDPNKPPLKRIKPFDWGDISWRL